MRWGWSTKACRPANAPLVIARAMPKTMSPSTWCRAAFVAPATPNVKRRLAAVLAIAVTNSATKLATWAPINGCSTMNNSR